MDKRLLANIIYWILIIVVILTCIFIYFYLTSNGNQCVANPIEYYEVKTQAQCFCSQYNYLFP